jgi:hypothetical protein
MAWSGAILWLLAHEFEVPPANWYWGWAIRGAMAPELLAHFG